MPTCPPRPPPATVGIEAIRLSIRYGPRQMKKPSFTGKGVLNCEIKFATFSCKKRRAYQRVRFDVVGLV